MFACCWMYLTDHWSYSWPVSQCNAQTTWLIPYTPTATMIRHAIGFTRLPAPTTLFHEQGRNLATELSRWPGQSCGTVCKWLFVTWTVYTLFKSRLKSHFLACVLMIDSVMPFRSGFAHEGHSTPFYLFIYLAFSSLVIFIGKLLHLVLSK